MISSFSIPEWSLETFSQGSFCASNIPFLKVQDLSYSYAGINKEEQLSVFSKVNFSLFSGERLAIMGASGVGKSTLLHVLGLLDHQTSGQVSFFLHGEELHFGPHISDNKKTDFRGSFIGFVYQYHHLLPDFTALENVMMPGRIMGKPFKPLYERALFLLEKVGLSQRLHHLPRELSGGQQQRVAIARALILSPKLVLADEPTGNLDEETSEAVMALLQDLHHHEEFSLIMATHNEGLLRFVDRLMIIERGTLEEKRIP